MDPKRLQKKIDKALSILSDHDDKKDEQRYINLRNYIEEAQEYVDKEVYNSKISLEYYDLLKLGMKEFSEERYVFIIFLIILTGLLFSGVFYITYSHMYDHIHKPGGHVRPSSTTRTRPTKTSDKTTLTTKTTSSIKTTSSTTTTTKATTTDVPTQTTTTKVVVDKPTTDKPSTTTTIKTTDKVDDSDDPNTAFVTLSFDNTNLIDLKNIFPVDDNIGLMSTPTKWSLSSSVVNSSKDYVLTYYVDFVDKLDDILPANRLDINNLKYQLLIYQNNNQIYNSGTQDMYDYPESEEGIRPIIVGKTMNNDQTLDFELRMWLASSVGNDQQGKQYRFKIDVYYEFEFIE